MEADTAELIHSGLKNIAKEIHELKTEDITFKEEIKRVWIENSIDFKRDTNQKFTDTRKKLATQMTRVVKDKQQIEETENWNMEVKDAVLQALETKNTTRQVHRPRGKKSVEQHPNFGLKEEVERNSVSQIAIH